MKNSYLKGRGRWVSFPTMKMVRRDAGVVERGGLENRCAFIGTVGSNPTPSAIRLRLRYDVINPLGFVIRRVREADATSKQSVDGPFHIILQKFTLA
jgi:hypothetical protein